MLHFTTGDMFERRYDVLTCTVNCVGIMGKGLAAQFKTKYPDYFDWYRNFCAQRDFMNKRIIRPGGVYIYDQTNTGQTILSAATKDHWRFNSRMGWVDSCLVKIRDIANGFLPKHCDIAIPPLGCGNGGLSWHDVKPLYYLHLRGCSQHIYIFEPEL